MDNALIAYIWLFIFWIMCGLITSAVGSSINKRIKEAIGHELLFLVIFWPLFAGVILVNFLWLGIKFYWKVLMR